MYTDPDDERSKPITPEQADKYRTTVRRGRSQLKQLVDSAYGFGPNDKTGNAKVVRREISEDLTKVDGLVFWAQVEIRKGRNGYGDSNCIGFIIVPGDPEYPQRHGGELALRPGDPDDKPSDLDDEIPY